MLEMEKADDGGPPKAGKTREVVRPCDAMHDVGDSQPGIAAHTVPRDHAGEQREILFRLAQMEKRVQEDVDARMQGELQQSKQLHVKQGSDAGLPAEIHRPADYEGNG